MSDILLSVGLQKGHVGSSQLEIDIKDVVARISKNPPKVSVGLKVDQSALNHFKSQLTQIVNSIGLTNGSPITVNISGLGEVGTKAKTAKKAFDDVKKASKAAGDAASNMGDKQNKALTSVNNMLKTMQENYRKWSAAQLTSASGEYQAYGEQIQALELLRQQVVDNTITYEQFIQQFQAIQAAASGAAPTIMKNVKEYKDYQAAVAECRKEIELLKQQQEKWTAAKTGAGSSDYAALARYEKQLESLLLDLQSGKITLEEFKQKLAGIKAEADSSRSSIKGLGKDTKSLGDKMKGLAEKFGSWLTVSQVIMAAVRALKKMVATVIELDTAMTELRKVTDESEATYTKFLDNAIVRAKKLGVSVKDVVNSSADFARLGLSLEEAEIVSDAALVYKNVGDDITDINEATESLISTMQAFGIEAENAMLIVDKFNTIGNKFAISSGGVGEAMLRSASAMHAAGNTIDETVALIAAANTVVQNPESVGKRIAQQHSNVLKEDRYIG